MVQLVRDQSNIEMELPIYAQEKYLSCNSENYGWFVSSRFVLPFVIYKIKKIFTKMIFTTQSIELIKSSETQERQFLNAIVEMVKNEKMCDVIYKSQPSAVFRTYPDNASFFEWGSYAIDIEPTMDEMFLKMKSKRRSCIRKAIRDGVKIEATKDLDEIFDILYSTIKRQNVPLLPNKEHLLKLKNSMFPTNMKMFKASYNGEIQCALIVYFSKEEAFYEWGGTIENPHGCSMGLLSLEVMLDLYHNHGIKTYDFVGAIIDVKKGSKEEGIQNFKKRFGSYLRKGYQFKVVINPLYDTLYNNLVKFYFKTKGVNYIDAVDRVVNNKYY